MHPDAAAFRDFPLGNLMQAFDVRGACRLRVMALSDIRPSSWALPTGTWFGIPGYSLDSQNVLPSEVGDFAPGKGRQRAYRAGNVCRLND